MNVILFSSWYPVDKDRAAGIFVKKHAAEMSVENFVAVHVVDFSNSVFLYRRKLSVINGNFHEYYYTFRNMGRVLNKIVSPFLYSIIFLKEFWLGKIKYDIININVVYHIGVYLFPLLYFIKKPIVITEHWTGYFEEDGRYFQLPIFIRKIVAAVFKKSSKVIVVSEALKVQLESLFEVGGKMEVVYNSIRFPEKINPKQSISSKLSFLTISYLDDKMKNISSIISAFRIIADKYPDIRLIIAGDGIDYDNLTRLKNKLNLQNNILFKGFVSNDKIPELYESSDVFILNSNFETFSIVTAEALAFGLPVIITKCRGPEFYVEEFNGIKIDKNNVGQLVHAIEFMIINYNKFDKISISEKLKQQLFSKSVHEEFSRILRQTIN